METKGSAGCRVLVHAGCAAGQCSGRRAAKLRDQGRKIVPVSGPALDDATVVVSRGIIVAVGKDVAIPPDAWVIEGKGLIVYPGLVDSFTDVGVAAAQSASAGEGTSKPQPTSRGPEDRPATTPWRNAADDINLG